MQRRIKMKLNKKLIILLAAAGFSVSACQNFEELEKNPNKTTKSSPALLLTSIENDFYKGPWSDVQRWNQYWCSNYNYYANQEYSWTGGSTNYLTLNDIKQMELEAASSGSGLPTKNAYSALAKFFKAFFYIDMTMRLGDIPMDEALRTSEGIFKPKYNTQKEVFLQSLTWLEEANADLAALIIANDKNLAGDFLLGGKLTGWQKAVNAFKLRLLIHLSKKEADIDLKVKQRFAETIANPAKYPLPNSSEDNLQYVYNTTTNKYPLNPDNFGNTATRNNMSATYLNKLVSLKDPRTFIVAEPAPAKIAAGLTPADFAAYVGASSGESLDDMSSKANKGEYSFIRKDRYYQYLGEPCIQIGYIELCFNIAEAINRGWVNGNAADSYNKGIRASMQLYGISTDAINAYLAQPEVAYSSVADVALNQILMQKYLGFFQNSGWEAYYNQRRTGVPTFLVGPGTANSQRIPKRFLYPSSEHTNNTENLTKALQSQFGGKDDINELMWILK
ncbi:SusD/RagB family nutrient-binding outer membrane lipoprotein [Solitalea lacus]|uniref:SusD/RagB family nutrient-binding outer membrane lipoprotein n=1 Tax=Solitalea lacus TaxID=2911172 RepID=UPI001EDA4A25|nr:SusD/RagB family nutrient-binding outer membrane lipoprotein [Solitalea lacus]UKJ08177.1 SusD/RagB family nutrient-binding outer membrane lipoprotein [Solitalea lacus]